MRTSHTTPADDPRAGEGSVDLAAYVAHVEDALLALHMAAELLEEDTRESAYSLSEWRLAQFIDIHRIIGRITLHLDEVKRER